MSLSLVVIEAPGKRAALQSVLYQCGYGDMDVQATVGHIAQNPPSLNPLLIAADYREEAYALRPDRELLAERIRQFALTAPMIYLATDDDQEGDVIARDVQRFCLSEVSADRIVRVRLKALTVDEVKSAFAQAMPLEPLDAARGDARRVIDRLIGSLSNEQAAVGRVQGSMLLSLAAQQPVMGSATYEAPAADGGAPWQATVPVYDPHALNPLDMRVPNTLSVGSRHESTLCATPMNHDDVLLAISLETGESLADVSRTMQRLYERGDMTYPRAKDRHVSPDALRRITATAKVSGCGFDRNAFKGVRQLNGDYAHEAPSSLRVDVPVNREMGILTLDEQVLVGITRHLLHCGMRCHIEQPSLAAIQQLPPELQGLPWQRMTPLAHPTWDLPVQQAGIQFWSKEQSLLHFAMSNQLGRPSTIVNHIAKFLSRDLVDNRFDLTDKGLQWNQRINELFSGKNISAVIEQYIDATKKAPNEMVQEMIALCDLHIGDSTQQQYVSEHETDDIEFEYSEQDDYEI